jgi:hypothetical protein
VRQLLAAGEHPERIAARLGTTPAAMARWLARHGQHDLARPFDRIDRQTRERRRRLSRRTA